MEKVMKRIIEPFWWTLFTLGGTIAALVLPILMLVFGIGIPFGFLEPPSYNDLAAFLESWWMRSILVVVISLSMYHWAHRFRYTLYEGLQLRSMKHAILFACYGTATVITVIAGIFLLF